MHRRNMLQASVSGLLSSIAATLTVRRADAGDAPAPPRLKVVYHLDDLDKVNFVIGNIQNHVDGVGGPDKVILALVVHGPALRAFHATSANPDLARHIGRLAAAGLELAACGNTMKAQNVTVADLLPGFVSAERGGVVRIAELQAQGYLYLRP
jgi:intracellular sulfur oxidation DsrE/DsrF family protein